MTVTAVRKDPDNLTMTLTAEFPVSPGALPWTCNPDTFASSWVCRW